MTFSNFIEDGSGEGSGKQDDTPQANSNEGARSLLFLKSNYLECGTVDENHQQD